MGLLPHQRVTGHADHPAITVAWTIMDMKAAPTEAAKTAVTPPRSTTCVPRRCNGWIYRLVAPKDGFAKGILTRLYQADRSDIFLVNVAMHE